MYKQNVMFLKKIEFACVCFVVGFFFGGGYFDIYTPLLTLVRLDVD